MRQKQSPEKSGWKLYILKCVDDHWYVGATSQSLEDRFKDHNGEKGDHRRAAATKAWKPVPAHPNQKWMCARWIDSVKDSSLQGKAVDDDWKKRKHEAEELERIVTAQLMIFFGVNRVRGGGKSDLVSGYEYKSDKGKDAVAINIAQSLGMKRRMVYKFVNDQIEKKVPPHYPSSKGMDVFVDFGFNVVVNGHCIQHKTLDIVPYDALSAKRHPRLTDVNWQALFKAGLPENPERSSDDLEAGSVSESEQNVPPLSAHNLNQDTNRNMCGAQNSQFVLGFIFAASSLGILAVMVFSSVGYRLQNIVSDRFLLISNGVIFSFLLLTGMYSLDRRRFPESYIAYMLLLIPLLLITPAASFFGPMTIERILLWRTKNGLDISVGLVAFQATSAVFASISAICIYVSLFSIYHTTVAGAVGAFFSTLVIVLFYFLTHPSGTLNGQEIPYLKFWYAGTSAIASLLCTAIFVFVSRDRKSKLLRNLYAVSFCIPITLLYECVIGIILLILQLVTICAGRRRPSR